MRGQLLHILRRGRSGNPTRIDLGLLQITSEQASAQFSQFSRLHALNCLHAVERQLEQRVLIASLAACGSMYAL
jgi:hypothetical protein